jgi:GT2 family glycosyltransferase
MTPTFSVIVPTKDRNDLLATCLERLAPGTQQYPADLYEVIVTDDSAVESAKALVRDRFSWARFTAGPRRGPASNRNHGASLATGDYLVFIDDDCEPEHDLLSGYALAVREGVTVYEGRITCRAGFDSPRETAPVNLTGGTLWSCNFAILRSAFARVKGFDERFPLPHMEDVDMRDRLFADGQRIEFVPGASVDHPPRRLPWGMKLGRMHKAGVLYMVLHPPVHGLAWFLQNQFRARVSHVLHSRKSVDSLTALASVPLELLTILLNWRQWMRWARATAGSTR